MRGVVAGGAEIVGCHVSRGEGRGLAGAEVAGC